MQTETITKKSALFFVMKQFRKIVEQKLESFSALKFEENVGEKAQFPIYILLTEKYFDRLCEIYAGEYELMHSSGISRSTIGEYIWINQWWMLVHDDELVKEKNLKSFCVNSEEFVSREIKRFANNYEERSIEDFMDYCSIYLSLRTLNKNNASSCCNNKSFMNSLLSNEMQEHPTNNAF